MARSGSLLKGGVFGVLASVLYILLFCCSGIILGIYSYFLSVLADRHDPIANWKRAVEGISGAACLYTLFAIILSLCVGGISVFAFLGIALDICFIGGMIAIAIMTRQGAHSCQSDIVYTPIGDGNPRTGTGFGSGFGEGNNSHLTYSVHYLTACRLNKAAFAVSIIAILLFLCAAPLHILLARNHQKEKRYGPSPANNYTSGSGGRRGIFGRKNRRTAAEKDAELGTYGAGAPASSLAPGAADTRPSAETGYTGSTVTAPNTYDKVDGHHGHAPHGSHGGYYTQPHGTGVNPYGYENTAPGTATNY